MLAAIKSLVHRSLATAGYKIQRLQEDGARPTYDHDDLRVWNKQVPFMKDERFLSAYRRLANSGHYAGPDLHIEWRLAVTIWAAAHGAKLPGDFVECGVNTGGHSLAICEYLNFNDMDKSFYLFDTFRGIPDDQMSEAEAVKRTDHEGYYWECYETARSNFAPFSRAILVRGKVPETLSAVNIERVAYLHIDMNIAYPERKAIEHFWPRLSPGAFVVLDDYGWSGYEEQHDAMNDFAASAGVAILSLPTGQGLLIKP